MNYFTLKFGNEKMEQIYDLVEAKIEKRQSYNYFSSVILAIASVFVAYVTFFSNVYLPLLAFGLCLHVIIKKKEAYDILSIEILSKWRSFIIMGERLMLTYVVCSICKELNRLHDLIYISEILVVLSVILCFIIAIGGSPLKFGHHIPFQFFCTWLSIASVTLNQCASNVSSNDGVNIHHTSSVMTGNIAVVASLLQSTFTLSSSDYILLSTLMHFIFSYALSALFLWKRERQRRICLVNALANYQKPLMS